MFDLDRLDGAWEEWHCDKCWVNVEFWWFFFFFTEHYKWTVLLLLLFIATIEWTNRFSFPQISLLQSSTFPGHALPSVPVPACPWPHPVPDSWLRWLRPHHRQLHLSPQSVWLSNGRSRNCAGQSSGAEVSEWKVVLSLSIGSWVCKACS